MPKFYNCVVCSKRTNPKNRRIINKSVKRFLQRKLFIDVDATDTICNKCIQKYYTAETHTQKVHVTQNIGLECPTNNNESLKSPPSINLPFNSTPRTHARCIICRSAGSKLCVISPEARLSAFLKHEIIIAEGSRCCPCHLQSQQELKTDIMLTMKTTDFAKVRRTTIKNLIKQLKTAYDEKPSHLNFDSYKDSDSKTLTGLTKDQFEDLCNHLQMKIKSTPARSFRTTIGLFLFKMKTGISNKIISTLMNISCSSVRRAIRTVRKAMMESFVPLYLGFESVTRDLVISKHTKPLAESIFDVPEGNMILILDGTYIYIQKSNNFAFQRQSYSIHKSRPLVKPMVIVSTTGHFVNIIGPYLAKNNDASILNHIIKQNIEDFKDYVKESDILVVDRGFRDSLTLLEDMGIKAAMPSFMKKGQRQMSAEEANASRLVTKIRWVVESANSRIKRFKYLDKVLPTNQVPCIGDYVRIICALANKYFPPLSSTESVASEQALATQMRERATQVNELQMFVEKHNLDRRTAKWSAVDECSLEFPRLTDSQLRDLTCGVYQLKLSPSYIQEHLDGECDIHVYKEDNNLLRIRIQSRHTSSRTYLLWIKFNLTDVIAWYCKCRAGVRVVGVCVHIAAVIWYLSSGRYVIGKLGVPDWGACLSNAKNITAVDSSDSDNVVSFVEE